MASASPIVHGVSPNRDRARMQRYGVRNQVLYDFFYAPWFLVPIVTVIHVGRLLIYRRNLGWAGRTLLYTIEGVRDCWRYRRHRAPWTAGQYWSHLALPAHGLRYVNRRDFPAPCS